MFSLRNNVTSFTDLNKNELVENVKKVKSDINAKISELRAGELSTDPTIILEPESLAEELQLARIGEFAARQADRERMERLIGPILTQTHRQNIYQKIYGETLSNA